jgi:hypothetical protein
LKSRRKGGVAMAIVFAGLFMYAALWANAAESAIAVYTPTNLGVVGSDTSSTGLAINLSGVAAGWSSNNAPGVNEHGFEATIGSISSIGALSSLGGTHAFGINASGAATGWSGRRAGTTMRSSTTGRR